MASYTDDDKQSMSKRKSKLQTRKDKDMFASSSGGSSDDDNEDSFDTNLPTNKTRTSSNQKKSKKRAVWEVIEGYRDPNMKVTKPRNYEGVLLKRRNWPMKGWHKRYFILADGILSYGKSKSDLTKNKIHGTINAYLSIVSYISSSRRILIDSSTQSSAFVCHLKARDQSEFDAWLENLKQHRLYYQFRYTQQYTAVSGLMSPANTNRYLPNNNRPSTSNNVNEQANSTDANNVTVLEPQNSPLVNISNQLKTMSTNDALPSLNVTDLSSQQTNMNINQQLNSSQNIKTMINEQNESLKELVNLNLSKDEQAIDVCFKQVEENLMNLSKVLSSLYLTSLAGANGNTGSMASIVPSLNANSGNLTSTSNLPSIASNTNQANVNSSPIQASNSTNSANSKLSNYVRKLVHHKQKSIDFISINTNSSKIHVSKSNPNLINNELQAELANQAKQTANGTSNNVKVPAISVNSNSFIPEDSTDTGSAGSGSGSANSGQLAFSLDHAAGAAVLNPKINNLNANNNTKSMLHNSLNVSTNSLLVNNDNQLIKVNFYQGAKQIYDQLMFLYQQSLYRYQKQTSPISDLDAERHLHRGQRSQSVMSSVSLQDSQLPFYDAIEYFTSDSESDTDSDQESDTDLNESCANLAEKGFQTSAIVPEELQTKRLLSRRRKLPAPAPDSSQVSVWGILRKAIGKDLTKISLPVILNEPLSLLQRLCEELEYSDLLDTANNIQDPYDRMVYVAAFIISGYASSYYRNGAKNFNPLLGETYELIRPDKGWRYIAEQVSHHPAVTCCQCNSKSFVHEQLFHAKVKFWGKSMEVHPEGHTRVTLTKTNETYQWNKISMYIYNVMGSSRRIEHYGEIKIRCTNGVSCKIIFPKTSYSSPKNEFIGEIICDNVVKRKIFGQWHETFLCGTDNTAKTIWRMGAMPEEASAYYGFTRFAIELNEFTENLKDELPPTDSRFRPDQRNLEEGDVENAEKEKQRIEENQRKRRKIMEERGEEHQPLWFAPDTSSPNSKDWNFNNQYWIKRENPGFKNMRNVLPNLW